MLSWVVLLSPHPQSSTLCGAATRSTTTLFAPRPAKTQLALSPAAFPLLPARTPLVRPNSSQLNLLDATLTHHLTSVASKELTENLTPLSATLTKNTGVGLRPHWLWIAEHGARNLNHIPLLFMPFHTLLRFFALPKFSTSFLSSNSTLFAKNTRGGGTPSHAPSRTAVLFCYHPASHSGRQNEL